MATKTSSTEHHESKIVEALNEGEESKAKKHILAIIEIIKKDPSFEKGIFDIDRKCSERFSFDVIKYCFKHKDNSLLKTMHRFLVINADTSLETVMEHFNPDIDAHFMEFLHLFFSNYKPNPSIANQEIIDTVKYLNAIIDKTPENLYSDLYVVLDSFNQRFMRYHNTHVTDKEAFSKLTDKMFKLEFERLFKQHDYLSPLNLYDKKLPQNHSIIKTLCLSTPSLLYNDPFIFDNFQKYDHIVFTLLSLTNKESITQSAIYSNYFSYCYKDETHFCALIQKHDCEQTPFYSKYKTFFDEFFSTHPQYTSNQDSYCSRQNHHQKIEYTFDYKNKIITIILQVNEESPIKYYSFNCLQSSFFHFREGILEAIADRKGFIIQADEHTLKLDYYNFINEQIDDFRVKMTKMIKSLASNNANSSLTITEE